MGGPLQRNTQLNVIEINKLEFFPTTVFFFDLALETPQCESL